MKKRISYTVIFALITVMLSICVFSASSFSDVPERHWAYTYTNPAMLDVIYSFIDIRDNAQPLSQGTLFVPYTLYLGHEITENSSTIMTFFMLDCDIYTYTPVDMVTATKEVLKYHAGKTYLDGRGYNGVTLEMLDSNTLEVSYSSVSSSYKLANFTSVVKLDEAIIAENTIMVPFVDSWDNSGYLYLILNPGNGGEMVKCVIDMVEYSPGALWSVYSDPDVWFMPE